MSLGFVLEDDEMRDEIRKASANNILIFAAAANNTTNEVIPIRFPARMQEVFAIFSSNAQGRPSDYNPPPKSSRKNFMFPGEKIEGAWPASLSDKETFVRNKATYKVLDGTSCATPIAAAIAAGVLEFAWQERVYQVSRVKLLKHITGMSDLFVRRMVDDYKVGEASYLYVKPWKLISTRRLKADIPVLISDTLENMDN